MKMVKQIQQQKKKIDQKNNKEVEEKKDIIMDKNGKHYGLILRCKIIKYKNMNIMDNIGNVKKIKNGQKRYQIYIIEFNIIKIKSYF